MTVGDLSFPLVDTAQGILAIQKVFCTLEPWFEAQCDVPAFERIVQRIQLQGRKYADTIDLSLKTSEDGIVLAGEVLVLFSEIAKGGNEIVVQSFFEGLLIIAATAHERATVCKELFQEIRSNIATIGSHVPRKSIELTGQLRSVKASAKRHNTASEVCAFVADTTTDATPGLVDFSPAGLIIPIALPLLGLVTRGTGQVFSRKAEKRQREHVSLNEALARLKLLEQDLEHIHSCLGHIVEWWGDIKDKLHDMEQVMRHQGISAYQTEPILNALQRGWSDIKERYRVYVSKVATIQDNYQWQYASKSEEMDVGFKGRLLVLQRDVKVLHDGLTHLETVSNIAWGSRREKFQRAIRSMQGTFLTCMTSLLECLRKLERSNDRGSVGIKVIKNHYAMREILQDLLEQTDSHCNILSTILHSVHHIVEEEHWRTKAFLANIGLGASHAGVTKESMLQLLRQMEEAVQGMARFCTDHAANGPWAGGDTFVERNIQPSVKNAVHAVEYVKDKLEKKP